MSTSDLSHPGRVPVVAAELVVEALDDELIGIKRTWDPTRRRFLLWRPGVVRPLGEDLVTGPAGPTPPDLPLGGLLAAAADCRAVAVLAFDRFVAACAGERTFELECPPGWGAELVVGTVAFPGADHRAAAVIATDLADTFRLLIVDAAAGRIDHEVALRGSSTGGFTIRGHPRAFGFVVDSGDGRLWSARIRDDALQLEAGPSGARFADFSPGGGEMLTIADGVVGAHRWPGWEPVAAGWAVGDHTFAGYLGPGHILLGSRRGLVVVDAGSGAATHRVVLDGAPDPESITRLGRRHLLTRWFRGERTGLAVWGLPEELVPS